MRGWLSAARMAHLGIAILYVGSLFYAGSVVIFAWQAGQFAAAAFIALCLIVSGVCHVPGLADLARQWRKGAPP